MSHGSNSEKTTKFEDWMQGDHVLLHLDSRREGVEVPAHLRNNPSLTLKVSYLFQGETTHDENGISTYLKFSGDYSKCVLPWNAIWGMTSADGKQMVWPKEMPNELLIAFAKQQLSALGRSVFGKKKSSPPEDPNPSGTNSPDPGKSHLRRVK